MIIENELKSVKEEVLKGVEDLLPEGVLLDFLSKGSKFLRSILSIYYIKSQGFSIDDNIIKILAVGEIIHNASLLHDDVIDEAEIRRSETTISKRFSSKISILSGDYLLTQSVNKLLDINNTEIMKIFLNSTSEMSKAEIKHFFIRGEVPAKEDYISVCKGKTAALFSAILESCAIYLGFDIKKANEFAELFGLCFQIKNDLDVISAIEDSKNKIYTAKEVIGIEKTILLLDNYKKKMRNLIKEFPHNEYKEGLDDLINSL